MIPQEFDDHAKNYREVLDASIDFSGEDSAYFAEYKIKDFYHELERRGIEVNAKLRLLDFGCGVGASIPYVAKYFRYAELLGADVSHESIDLARSKCGDIAKFFVAQGSSLPVEIESLDAAYAMCVFHHVDDFSHVGLLTKIRERLKPNGLLMVYEHNPLNPLTVSVVNHCPFDINAKLIRASVMADRCRKAGFRDVQIKYRVFFPGFLGRLRFLEKFMTKLPFGGQYYVSCLA